MKKDYRIGLVARIDESFPDYIPDEEWRFRFNYFKDLTDVVVFDWRDVQDGANVEKCLIGNKNNSKIVEGVNLSDFCDMIHVGQLGKIYNQPRNFSRFLKNLESYKGRVINPIETIRENLSKQYLVDFYFDGLPVVPSIEVTPNLFGFLKNGVFSTIGSSDVVLKPKFMGEGGNDICLISSFENDGKFREYFARVGEVIAQPLNQEIFSNGEDSLIFLNGRFSHALNKFTGELKVNEVLPAVNPVKYTRKIPSRKQMENAMSVLSQWPTPVDYARVDMIGEGNSYVSEVELINPALYDGDLKIMPEFIKRLDVFFDEVMLK